jgi:hypothetical protein
MTKDLLHLLDDKAAGFRVRASGEKLYELPGKVTAPYVPAERPMLIVALAQCLLLKSEQRTLIAADAVRIIFSSDHTHDFQNTLNFCTAHHRGTTDGYNE